MKKINFSTYIDFRTIFNPKYFRIVTGDAENLSGGVGAIPVLIKQFPKKSYTPEDGGTFSNSERIIKGFTFLTVPLLEIFSSFSNSDTKKVIITETDDRFVVTFATSNEEKNIFCKKNELDSFMKETYIPPYFKW